MGGHVTTPFCYNNNFIIILTFTVMVVAVTYNSLSFLFPSLPLFLKNEVCLTFM